MALNTATLKADILGQMFFRPSHRAGRQRRASRAMPRRCSPRQGGDRATAQKARRRAINQQRLPHDQTNDADRLPQVCQQLSGSPG
jgi:hypothetical protein